MVLGARRISERKAQRSVQAHPAAHDLRSGSRSVLSGAPAPVIEAILEKTGGRDAALSGATTGDVADQECAPTSPNHWHWFRAITPQLTCERVKQNASAASFQRCVPSMIIDLEVKVLWEVGRDDPSEPQGEDRERIAERSG